MRAACAGKPGRDFTRNDKLKFIGPGLTYVGVLEDSVVRIEIDAGGSSVKFYFINCLSARWF